MKKLPAWLLPLGLVLTVSGGLWVLVYLEWRAFVEADKRIADRFARTALASCAVNLDDFEEPEVDYHYFFFVPLFTWSSKSGPPYFAVTASRRTETAWIYKTNADGEILHAWSCGEE